VPEDKVDAFIASLRKEYAAYQNLDDEQIKEVIFATRPSSGACGK
jgi:hypothetical protein